MKGLEGGLKEKLRERMVKLWGELSSFLLKAGRGMTIRSYMFGVFVPLTVFGILVALVLKLFVFRYFPVEGVVGLIPYIFPLLCIFVALIYPFYYIYARAKNIDTHIPLFITYLATLATTGPSRKILFRMASEKEEFETLAEEAGKIVKIADSWNMGFIKACRAVAKTTPSVIFQDFLERLAHSFQAGEDIKEFLRKEVNVVMNEYERMYKRSLYHIETANNMYLNMIITLAFVAAFALIFPMLTNMSITGALYGMFLLFFLVDLAMLLFIRKITPKDDLMHHLAIKSKDMLMLEKALLPTIFISFIIFIILLFIRPFSTPVNVAISQTPLIFLGILAGKVEARVMRKDDNFPTFIRTVGAAAGVRGGSLTPVIGALRLHNYGALTADIQALYRRLTLGNVNRSWRFFAGETGSNLIDKFSRIFIESTYSGGDTAEIGETLGNSFARMIGLRKFRRQLASSLKGMLYSAMVGISISIFIIVTLVDSLGKGLFGGGSISLEGIEFMPIKFTAVELDMSLIIMLVWVLLLMHAAISSLIIKTVDGGHMYNSLVHYVSMMWIGTVITVLIPRAFQEIIPI
ncbi:type II secretion system F family protein [Candidatus Pyrohabitans sp.]